MATLDELLKGEQGGEYTDVAGYLKDPNYTDSQIIDITDRQIGEIKDQTSTFKEERSQLLTFRMERRPDGYDLTKTTMKIGYQLADGTGGESAVINVRANSDYIQFSWLVPAAATQKAGKLLIMVYAVASSYTYKTLAKQYEIKETLEIGGTLPEPDVNWYTDFIRQMDSKIAQAASSAASAATSAAAAEKSKTDAAAILAETEQVKENAIAAIDDKCNSFAEIDKIKNVTLSGSAEGSYISVEDAANWRLSNLEVQGKSEQAELTGKNLFNKNTTIPGKYVNNDTGELVNNSVCSASDYIPISTGNVFISAETTGTRFGAFYNSDKVFISGIRAYGAVAVPESAKYMRITVNTEELKTAQLEKGTAVTPYEPYCGGIPAPNPEYPQEIASVENPSVTVCGKNLLDVTSKKNAASQKVTAVIDGSNIKLKQIGEVTSAGWRQYYYTSNFRPTPGVSIRLSCTIESNISGATPSVSLEFIKDGKTAQSIVCGSQKIVPVYDFVRVFFLLYNTSTPPAGATLSDEVIFKEIQAEYVEGVAGATAYQPYTGHTATLQGITLRSLPDGTADRLEKRDGVWGIERNIGQYIVDGSADEAWEERVINTTWYAHRLRIHDGELFNNKSRMLCSSFPILNTNKWGTLEDNGVFIGATVSAGFVYFHTADNKNLAAFKTWLSDNPITIDYALATPTWEPLPDTLQAELNALQCYTGQTNIFTDSPLQPAIKVEYIQDPNKVIYGLKTEIENIKSQLQPQA